VGGRRRFTLIQTGCGRRSQLPCGLFSASKDGAAIEYPASTAVTFTVDAQAVCRPRIVLITAYAIPADKRIAAAERSCD